jgi:hypothetical protein
MYLSFDDGAHWQPFNLNLPQIPITDIKVHHKDLVVSTQGRAIWILDNISALHQLTSQSTASAVHLYKPRDGYRTRVSPTLLGPVIEYYLPAAAPGTVTLEILDAAGAVVSSYNSETPVGGGGRGRGGRGAAATGAGQGAPTTASSDTAVSTTSMESQDPDAGSGGGGRGRGGPPPRVTKEGGMNRVAWDVRNASGLAMPPGPYQARLRVGDITETQPFNVLIDPRVAEEGVTVADLKEQFDHNVRMRELNAAAAQLLGRVKSGLDGPNADKLREIYLDLVNTPEGVRYNKPGLQAHIQYLASMTTGVDQKIGRDAIDRYQALKKQLDTLKAQADKLLQ